MHESKAIEARPSSLADWFAELLRGPVAPTGDYFERLQFSVQTSAPECQSCL